MRKIHGKATFKPNIIKRDAAIALTGKFDSRADLVRVAAAGGEPWMDDWWDPVFGAAEWLAVWGVANVY